MSLLRPNQPNSLFHALPQELRDEIIALVVISPAPLLSRIKIDDTQNSAIIQVAPSQPALSRVDRATRASTLRIFFSDNTFLFRASAADKGPLCRWLEVVERSEYTHAAGLIQHVIVEKSVRKTCDVLGQNPHLQQQQMLAVARTGVEEKHLYRVAIDSKPGSDVRVTFQADLAGMCACAMRRAAQLLTKAHRLRAHNDSNLGWDSSVTTMCAALAFGQEAEVEISMTEKCHWAFCNEKFASSCTECGLRVQRQQKTGHWLVDMYENDVRQQTERAERLMEVEARMAESAAALRDMRDQVN